MYHMEKLYEKGVPLKAENVCDPYTNWAFANKLENYKIYNLASLIGGERKLQRGVDVPDYCFDFIAEQEECLGIANVVNGKVDYIIMKSLKEKKFLTCGDKRSVPYGIGTFKNFQFGDWLVIVEGLKDRDTLSVVYPNVIATQTAGMGSLLKEIVLSLTNRFILMYDNASLDEAGKKAFYRDRKFLESNNCQVVWGNHPDGVKDTGEIADALYKSDWYQSEYLKSYYSMQIRSIIGG